jgi:hypothetical protein
MTSRAGEIYISKILLDNNVHDLSMDEAIAKVFFVLLDELERFKKLRCQANNDYQWNTLFWECIPASKKKKLSCFIPLKRKKCMKWGFEVAVLPEGLEVLRELNTL